jgi:hypothetical protein
MFRYPSGEVVERGDRVLFHSQPARIEFVVSERTGNAAIDWYLDEYVSCGLMISAEGFGHVFLTADDIDEHLAFVARNH